MADDDEDAPRATRRRASSYDALWERVDNQGSAIRALGEETAIQFRDLRGEMARANSELATSFKATTADIATTLTALGTKFDSTQAEAARNSRPQYGALILGMLTAIGVAVTIIQWQTSLHDKPVDDKLAALTTAIGDLTKNTASAFGEAAKASVSQSEYRLTLDFTKQISDLKTINATAKAERMQSQIDKLDADQVPRAEHQFHWNGEMEARKELQNQITALQNRMDMLAPAGDMLKRLTDRQHEIELRVFGVKPTVPGS